MITEEKRAILNHGESEKNSSRCNGKDHKFDMEVPVVSPQSSSLPEDEQEVMDPLLKVAINQNNFILHSTPDCPDVLDKDVITCVEWLITHCHYISVGSKEMMEQNTSFMDFSQQQQISFIDNSKDELARIDDEGEIVYFVQHTTQNKINETGDSELIISITQANSASDSGTMLTKDTASEGLEMYRPNVENQQCEPQMNLSQLDSSQLEYDEGKQEMGQNESVSKSKGDLCIIGVNSCDAIKIEVHNDVTLVDRFCDVTDSDSLERDVMECMEQLITHISEKSVNRNKNIDQQDITGTIVFCKQETHYCVIDEPEKSLLLPDLETAANGHLAVQENFALANYQLNVCIQNNTPQDHLDPERSSETNDCENEPDQQVKVRVTGENTKLLSSDKKFFEPQVKEGQLCCPELDLNKGTEKLTHDSLANTLQNNTGAGNALSDKSDYSETECKDQDFGNNQILIDQVKLVKEDQPISIVSQSEKDNKNLRNEKLNTYTQTLDKSPISEECEMEYAQGKTEIATFASLKTEHVVHSGTGQIPQENIESSSKSPEGLPGQGYEIPKMTSRPGCISSGEDLCKATDQSDISEVVKEDDSKTGDEFIGEADPVDDQSTCIPEVVYTSIWTDGTCHNNNCTANGFDNESLSISKTNQLHTVEEKSLTTEQCADLDESSMGEIFSPVPSQTKDEFGISGKGDAQRKTENISVHFASPLIAYHEYTPESPASISSTDTADVCDISDGDLHTKSSIYEDELYSECGKYFHKVDSPQCKFEKPELKRMASSHYLFENELPRKCLKMSDDSSFADVCIIHSFVESGQVKNETLRPSNGDNMGNCIEQDQQRHQYQNHENSDIEAFVKEAYVTLKDAIDVVCDRIDGDSKQDKAQTVPLLKPEPETTDQKSQSGDSLETVTHLLSEIVAQVIRKSDVITHHVKPSSDRAQIDCGKSELALKKHMSSLKNSQEGSTQIGSPAVLVFHEELCMPHVDLKMKRANTSYMTPVHSLPVYDGLDHSVCDRKTCQQVAAPDQDQAVPSMQPAEVTAHCSEDVCLYGPETMDKTTSNPVGGEEETDTDAPDKGNRPGVCGGAAFKWRYLPSMEVDVPSSEPALDINDDGVVPEMSIAHPVLTCKKPLRLGLSRRHRVQSLHQHFKKELV